MEGLGFMEDERIAEQRKENNQWSAVKGREIFQNLSLCQFILIQYYSATVNSTVQYSTVNCVNTNAILQ